MISAVLRLLKGFSYKEKSILISLMAVAGVYGAYFIDLLSDPSEHTLSAMLASMIGIVVMLVVVHIVFHIVISLDDVSEADDERDKAVNRKASVSGYNILFIAVLTITGRVVVVGAWGESAEVAVPTLFEIANLLLAGLVVSEVIYYAAQLYFYRRGLNG